MNLAKIMSERGMNQVELAKRSGVSQGLISSYLRGGRAAKLPSIANLLSIATALRCTPNELLGWPKEAPYPSGIMEAADKLSSLPPDHPTRKAIETLLGVDPGEDIENKTEGDKKD